MPADSVLLAEVPLFQCLDDEGRAALAQHLDVVNFPAGHTIFEYGDPGDALFVIRTGEVEMFFKDDTGERIVLETATTGDFFGELSMLDEGSRSASVLVTRDVEALRLDRGDLAQFLKLRPEAALDLLTAMGKRLRTTVELLRHTASRNVNEEMEDKRTIVQKISDAVAEFTGSVRFLMIHAGWFAMWIMLNIGLLPFIKPFDAYPFGLLTMIVSLEAIFLSVFVLISQNRQAAKEHVRSDIEYEVNLKAELEIAHLHEKLDHLHAETLSRLTNIERSVGVVPVEKFGDL